MIDWIVDTFREMEELILDLATTPWFYAVLFIIAFLDSVVPIVPSEFTVIAGGVAAGAGELIDDQRILALALVILFGALGAYAGDSMAYWLGNRSDKLVRRWFFRGEKGDQRLISTGEQIRKRGGLLLITARFIPGGRTAMTFSCGLTGQPFLSWFTRWDILATTLWASYAGVLGFLIADAVSDTSQALWIAFGLAVSITLAVEGVRWMLERRRERRVA